MPVCGVFCSSPLPQTPTTIKAVYWCVIANRLERDDHRIYTPLDRILSVTYRDLLLYLRRRYLPSLETLKVSVELLWGILMRGYQHITGEAILDALQHG
jgi:hypothetical protein